jgi:hypothetical protein
MCCLAGVLCGGVVAWRPAEERGWEGYSFAPILLSRDFVRLQLGIQIVNVSLQMCSCLEITSDIR